MKFMRSGWDTNEYSIELKWIKEKSPNKESMAKGLSNEFKLILLSRLSRHPR